jgi:hypothetical protein
MLSNANRTLETYAPRSGAPLSANVYLDPVFLGVLGGLGGSFVDLLS